MATQVSSFTLPCGHATFWVMAHRLAGQKAKASVVVSQGVLIGSQVGAGGHCPALNGAEAGNHVCSLPLGALSVAI